MESTIKWQTGEPKKSGWYIITTIGNKVTIGLFAEDKKWYLEEDVIAWCSLSDIKPYKE